MIFDLGTVMLFSTVAVGVLSFKFYRRFNDGMHTAAIWTLMTIVLMIGLFLIAIMLINQRRFPSHVDTSPLAQLTAEQVARVDDIWIQFEAHESVLHFRAEDSNSRELNRTYSIAWQDEDFISMHISVNVFRDERTLINSMRNKMRLMDSGGPRRYTYIAYDNNTEAVLEYIFTDMPYPFPTSHRSIWTDIRIGNVSIWLAETRHANNLENDFSSQFIALLVEMLQEE